MTGARIIYVSGNVGSGKTTLASRLGGFPDWALIPEKSPPLEYLPDLFSDPARWAMETQLAFLASKVETVRSVEGTAALFAVIDRSIFEHYEVFARTFHQTGAIDERSMGTFSRLHHHLIQLLPSPAAIVICEASSATCQARLRRRSRSIDTLYPDGHVDRLAQNLSNWARNYGESAMFALDTEKYDTRDLQVVDQVRSDLVDFTSGRAASLAILRSVN